MSLDDFADPRHSAAFRVIVAMNMPGAVVDPMTVAAELERCADMSKHDARLFVAGLLEYADTRSGAVQHASLVPAFLSRGADPASRALLLGRNDFWLPGRP